jgi:translocation and assembly module TamA
MTDARTHSKNAAATYLAAAVSVLGFGLLGGVGIVQAGEPQIREQRICEKLSLQGTEHISFSETETRLMCGDPENEAWDNVPETQTLFHLRTFLQDRGYYLTSVARSEPNLLVDLGKKSFVKRMEWEGTPPELNVSRIRELIGNVLTPKFLDQTKDRVAQILRANGHPCAQVSMTADPVSETVRVTILSDALSRFGLVKADDIPGLDQEALRRYDAFRFDDPYNDDNLIISARRMTMAGLVQSTHFSPICEPPSSEVPVKQSILAGPPRNLMIGFGADTERYAHLKASWQKTRIGAQGSSVTIESHMAVHQQEINGSANWYYLPFASRHFLAPQFKLLHDDEQPYETLEADLQTQPSIQFDSQDYSFTGALGPAVNWVHTYRSGNTYPGTDAYFAYMGTSFRITSHDYEFYQNSPRTGTDASFTGTFTRAGILSNVTAQMLQFNFERLWNFLEYDPPILILGVRGGFSTTFGPTSVPPTLRTYLGGSTDLRGFNRQQLAGRTGMGALSSAFLCLEARTFDLLPWGLQPFIFTDFGALGEHSLSLDPPVYFSPGVGLRWESPIGALRATIAHGYLLGDTSGFPPGAPGRLSDWRPYFSFGEEF